MATVNKNTKAAAATKATISSDVKAKGKAKIKVVDDSMDFLLPAKKSSKAKAEVAAPVAKVKTKKAAVVEAPAKKASKKVVEVVKAKPAKASAGDVTEKSVREFCRANFAARIRREDGEFQSELVKGGGRVILANFEAVMENLKTVFGKKSTVVVKGSKTTFSGSLCTATMSTADNSLTVIF